MTRTKSTTSNTSTLKKGTSKKTARRTAKPKQARKAKKPEAEKAPEPMDLNVKQAPQDKFTPAQVIQALQLSGGVFSLAAEKLKCARSTVGYYVGRYKPVEEALEDISEELLDLGEAQLITFMRDKYFPAVCFYLKTKGKKRGYSERVEQTGADGGPMDHRHQIEDARSELARKFDRIADVQQAA